MKLGLCVMAPEPISMACVYMCIPSALWKHYCSNKHIRKNRTVGSVAFYVAHVIPKERRQLAPPRTSCSEFWALFFHSDDVLRYSDVLLHFCCGPYIFSSRNPLLLITDLCNAGNEVFMVLTHPKNRTILSNVIALYIILSSFSLPFFLTFNRRNTCYLPMTAIKSQNIL
jgi:hypothetical protein